MTKYNKFKGIFDISRITGGWYHNRFDQMWENQANDMALMCTCELVVQNKMMWMGEYKQDRTAVDKSFWKVKEEIIFITYIYSSWSVSGIAFTRHSHIPNIPEN